MPALELPVGKAVELSPGGHHVMLQDLKQVIAKDSVVPMTLVFRNAAGVESRLDLRLPVLAQAPGALPGASSPAHKH
jgi:copper(I)-binding protein